MRSFDKLTTSRAGTSVLNLSKDVVVIHDTVKANSNATLAEALPNLSATSTMDESWLTVPSDGDSWLLLLG